MTTSKTIASGTTPPTLSFAELNADPHATYQRLRSRYPFLRREDGAFMILRARDIQGLLNDPRTRQVETELLTARGISSGPVFDFIANSLLFANGAAHQRRRRPLSKYFAFKMMADLRPKIRALTEELLDQSLVRGTMKLRDDYAALIPAITIAGILGIPRSDVPRFTSMVYRVSKIFTTSWTTEDLPEIEAATRDLTEYAAGLIAERRKFRQDDFLSEYVSIVDEASEMSAMEVVMQIVSIILGGSDTTRAAIVIQTGLLLDRPDLWKAICHDQRLVAPAIAEALRYEPAVGSIPRLAMEDIILDGHVIPKGHPMLLATISSMRDPEAFPDPAKFKLQREQPRWLPVFGGGPHRCLGEALAKIELEEALAALTTRHPDLRLAGQPLRVHGHSGIRTVDELEVR